MDNLQLEQVVRAHQEMLYRFAISLTGHEADAVDLLQQTFYLFARKGHALRDPSRTKSWLFTTHYREFLRIKRRADLHPLVELSIVEEEASLLAPAPETDSLDIEIMLQALHKIDETYRGPLVLFFLEEMSYKEIAAILEIPIGTVMSRISRGKERLRSILRDSTSSVRTMEAEI